MEGLQGYVLGTIVTSLFWVSVLLVVMRKAYFDGHIAGQKACGRVEPEEKP